MRASVHARLRSGFEPLPAGGAALFADPLMAFEDARRRWHVEVTFSASHSSSAGVPWHFDDLCRAFAVLAIGPRTRELQMLVTMFGARLHPSIIR